jgi:hypothetical protein
MKTIKVTLDDDYDFTAEQVESADIGWDDVAYVDVEDDSEEVYVIVVRHLDEDDVEKVFLAAAYDDEDDAHDFAYDMKGSNSQIGVLERVHVETVRIS